MLDERTVSGRTLEDRLHWRYATKKMDPARAVPAHKVERIVDAVRLAPTSSGLQPFELIVVEDPELRAKMRDIAMDQSQLTDGSHVLVFAAWDGYSEERIDGVVADMAAQRGEIDQGVKEYYARLKESYLPRAERVNFEHAARQTYIALGLALTAAAFEEVDSTPMEGFDNDAMDRLLGLRDRGLRSVAILPLGYREADGDWLVNLKKVRRPVARLVTYLK